jgi:outer membrane protein assembly factor BamD
MSLLRSFLRRLLPAALFAAAACAPSFQPRTFKGSNEQLFTSSMRAYERHRWDDAVAGFERLTLELPARDTLLPLAHYWLGRAHGHRGEHLLAAQAFARVTESFPDHPLADEALYATARSYQKMWRKPTLDAQYGETALATYRLYLAMYPNATQRPQAERELARLEEWYATKDYENGMFYRRRKYFDSALIYFRNVVSSYPNAPKARLAYLRMIETYREIKYAADAAEACGAALKAYPQDLEVRAACPAGGASPAVAAPVDTAQPPSTAPPATPPGSTPSAPPAR